MKILVVEDDPIQSEELCDILSDAFAAPEIVYCSSENQFIRDIPSYRASPPDIAIVDLMIAYYTLDELEEFKTAPDELKGDRAHFQRAGMRCWRAFQAHPETSPIPVIIHSVVELHRVMQLFDSPPLNLHFLDKAQSETKLLPLIRSLVPHYPPKVLKKRSIIDTVLDATEAKPGAFGLRLDLKKLTKKRKQ